MADKIKEKKERINSIHKDLVNDYLNVFKVMKNGTLHANNENCTKVQNFLDVYEPMFRALGYRLKTIEPFEHMGQSDVEKLNRNKQRMLDLFGIASQLYLGSCSALGIQPDYKYVEFQIIEDFKNE
ncbi:19405_t:CDS:1 [Dentiscutata erythropus]|uniref:19405_t:CDS:1 n=1 Tax=Dentiscutata erythropus TaxID=1348616 RepID=A0A9N9HZV7_9GLOM|nr:19405_t:CDS:1 [Dentiscutata erythropus]